MLEAFSQIGEIHDVFLSAEHVLEEDIGRPICIANCGLCCISNVPHAITIEAIYAVSILAGMGRLKKMESIAEGWLLEHHPFATIYEGMPHGYTSPQLRDEWVSVSRSQCPFLDTMTMECIVHDCRPFTCRAYGVTRDSAELCPRPLGRGESISQRRYIPAEKLREFIGKCRSKWEIKNKAWIVSGFFPAVLYRAAQPEKFKGYVLDNRIASAKLVGVEYETSLMWQPQVNMLRAGKSADLVAAMGTKIQN